MLKSRIEDEVQQTGSRLSSIVVVGAITAAKLLGETGDPRRFRSLGGFAMVCGAATIPASSGQTRETSSEPRREPATGPHASHDRVGPGPSRSEGEGVCRSQTSC